MAIVLALAAVASAAEAEWEDEGRAVIPHLDLEVWVSTALRLDPQHTEMYSQKLLALVRELFGAQGHEAPLSGQRPTWCVTLDHGGTLELGTRAILRKAHGKVYRAGQPVGGGEERRWILPVRRRCTIRFAVYKRVGDAFISGPKFAFREPASWDEELYGGVQVASIIRAAGEKKPRCPVTLEEARAKALQVLEPPGYAIKPAILRRLLDLDIVRVRDVRGAAVKGHQKLGLYVVHLAAHNRTPWFVHSLKGRHFARYRGDRVYCIDIDFSGTIPPGRTHVFPSQATDFEGPNDPPLGALTGIRWSLKGRPQ